MAITLCKSEANLDPDASARKYSQTSGRKRCMRLGCEGYGQDGTWRLRDDAVRDVGGKMRSHHRRLTDPQDDQLGFLLLGIFNYRVRDLATVCDRANRRIDGRATLDGDLLQGLGHNLRNDVTPVTAFERPRKHMQAMEG